MSDLFDILQERYQALVAGKTERDEAGQEEFLEDVRTFIADARQAGAGIADLDERSQLRTCMRFLADTLYDATGAYPDVTLQPLARGHLVRPEPRGEPQATPAPSLAWMLLGGATTVVIAVGLFLIGWLSRPPKAPEQTPTPAPVPFVSHAAVGAGLETDGTLQMKTTADTFCAGTPEIIAELELQRIKPDTQWRWEVLSGDDIVAAQPAAPVPSEWPLKEYPVPLEWPFRGYGWGSEPQGVTFRALTGGPDGVEPGQYGLLIYADGQLVGSRSFRVLDTPPRIFNLQVADVPEPTGEAPVGRRFDPGVRVIYLTYDFEGFCPALGVAHTLYRDGEPIQERVTPWSGEPRGQAQVSFQAPGDLPFPSGDYEVALVMSGKEQTRAGFAIQEETVPVETAPPAFGDVTLALGVQTDGKPILTPPDIGFDWNTKVIYAIFDYVEMTDGLSWAAVWNRGGREAGREEDFWDTDADGTEGTHWVTYQNERGQVLAGGNYSVTLYIENVAQRTADFNIRYYVPPE